MMLTGGMQEYILIADGCYGLPDQNGATATETVPDAEQANSSVNGIISSQLLKPDEAADLVKQIPASNESGHEQHGSQNGFNNSSSNIDNTDQQNGNHEKAGPPSRKIGRLLNEARLLHDMKQRIHEEEKAAPFPLQPLAPPWQASCRQQPQAAMDHHHAPGGFAICIDFCCLPWLFVHHVCWLLTWSLGYVQLQIQIHASCPYSRAKHLILQQSS